MRKMPIIFKTDFLSEKTKSSIEDDLINFLKEKSEWLKNLSSYMNISDFKVILKNQVYSYEIRLESAECLLGRELEGARYVLEEIKSLA